MGSMPEDICPYNGVIVYYGEGITSVWNEGVTDRVPLITNAALPDNIEPGTLLSWAKGYARGILDLINGAL